MVTAFRSVLVSIVLLLALALISKAQVPQWNQVTDSLLADVDLSERLPSDLNALQFVDETTGFISTHNGEVIRTEDGGITWKLFYADFAGSGGYFNEGGYYFLTKNLWFSVPAHSSAKWARTLDAGKHWEFFNNTTCPDVTPFFLNADDGWGISVSSICSTVNGGKNWTVLAQHPGGVNALNRIFVLDTTHGWVTGEGQVFATTDGAHWTKRSQDSSIAALELHFLTPTQGYARVKVYDSERAGHQQQRMIYSSDGGRHWQPSTWSGGSASEPQVFSNCVSLGEKEVWVIGYSSKANSNGPNTDSGQYDFVLFRSRDGGASFASIGKLPDNAGQPRSIAIASQKGRRVLLVLDTNAALWQAFLSDTL